MIASKEEIAKAEVEAWHRTNYRLDWLLYRTLGYAILSSTLAIYVFWDEAGRGQYTPSTILALSVTWLVLLSMGMLWYDFHTRVSYEHWPEVRARLSRHILVSVCSFGAAFVFAYGIHGVCTLIDRNITAPPATINGKPNIAATSNVVIGRIHWRKGDAPLTTFAKGARVNLNKTPNLKPAASFGDHAKASAPNNGKPAGTAAAVSKSGANKASSKPAKKADPPAKKPAAKPSKPAKKHGSSGLPSHPFNGMRTVWHGQNYHYYGGRWHLVAGHHRHHR